MKAVNDCVRAKTEHISESKMLQFPIPISLVGEGDVLACSTI